MRTLPGNNHLDRPDAEDSCRIDVSLNQWWTHTTYLDRDDNGEGRDGDFIADSDGNAWAYNTDSEEWEIAGASVDDTGPVNNNVWILGATGHDPLDMAATIAHWNTAVIEEEATGMHGLAYTGAGMDLSWQMAASFVALGYYPPMGLEISQGRPSDTWEYGVHQIGEPMAIRVRDAYKERYAIELRRITFMVDAVDGWHA